MAPVDALMQEPRQRGYRVMGPGVRGDVIVTTEIRQAADLPRGVGDSQYSAHYRIVPRDDGKFLRRAAPASEPRAK